MEYVREGDTVHVHSIDRLARDLGDLLGLLRHFKDHGVGVQFHKEQLTFTGTSNPFQDLQLNVIGAVAQFERAIIKERQREGIAKAKTKGIYKGRKPSIDREKVKALLDQGQGPFGGREGTQDRSQLGLSDQRWAWLKCSCPSVEQTHRQTTVDLLTITSTCVYVDSDSQLPHKGYLGNSLGVQLMTIFTDSITIEFRVLRLLLPAPHSR